MIKNYLRLARIDHWVKNVFVIPGALVVLFSLDNSEWFKPSTLLNFFLILLAACLTSSANYTINEWVDRTSDSYHPEKSKRPAVRLQSINARGVVFQYSLLSAAAFGLAIFTTDPTRVSLLLVIFLISGIVYNIRPLRLKEWRVLDVAVEGANNPIRFLLGWSTIKTDRFPNGYLLVGYFASGVFLMIMKRYAEKKYFDKLELDPYRYRKSLSRYSYSGIIAIAITSATISVSTLGIYAYGINPFLVFTTIPLTALFLIYYFLGLRSHMSIQHPEKLWNKYVLLLFAFCILVLVWVRQA